MLLLCFTFQHTTIRTLKYIVILTAALLWIFYAVPAICLQFPYVQSKVKEIATNELSNRLGVPVQIESIDLTWLNHLVLKDVYVEDQEGTVLLQAKQIAAGLDILPLISQQQFVFNTARLFGFQVNLKKKNPKDVLNLQFIIDAFAPKDTLRPKTKVNLRFKTIVLHNGNFSFHVASTKQTRNKFNAQHIDIHDISAKIAIKTFTTDSINAEIKRLSLTEQSGINIKRIKLEVSGNKDSLRLKDLTLQLPNTDFHIKQAYIRRSGAHDSLSEKRNAFLAAPLDLKIEQSTITPADLAAFAPILKNFRDPIELVADAKGSIDNINLRNLTLHYADKLHFIGTMKMKGLPDISQTTLFGEVKKMYITTQGVQYLANNFSNKEIALPEPITQLGTINFTGNIAGYFSNLLAHGKLSTRIGSIETDVRFGKDIQKGIQYFINGHVRSEGLDLKQVLPENNPMGNVSFDVKLDAAKPIEKTFAGKIDGAITRLDYKGYRYADILLAGNFDTKGYNGSLQIIDPNGQLVANGVVSRNGAASVFDFTADIKHFRPDKMNLTKKYESPDISAKIKANLKGNHFDNFVGDLMIDSLDFRTKPDSFFIKQFKLSASGDVSNRLISIHSPILNGEIIGNVSFPTMVKGATQTLSQYIPSVFSNKKDTSNHQINNVSIALTVENTENLSKTLLLPFTNIRPAHITGLYNDHYGKFNIEVSLPEFRIGNLFFDDGFLSINNPSDQANLLLKATKVNPLTGAKDMVSLKADVKKDKLRTLLSWENNKQETYKANLSATTTFVKEKNEQGIDALRTEISIHKSPLILNDSLWHILPSAITIAQEETLVDYFRITNNRDKQLLVDGTISKNNPDKEIHADLQNIELKYIFDIVNKPFIDFEGQASGRATASDLFGSRTMNTSLQVDNFGYNKTRLGKLDVFGEWDDEQKSILLLGTIYNNDSTWTDIAGNINPLKSNAGLSLYFDAKELDVSFIRPFVKTIAKDLKGRASGKVLLEGYPFTDMEVEGDIFVQDAGLGIDFTKTYYTFEDSIHLRRNAIKVKDLVIHDKDGNSGVVDFTFRHKYFRDFNFNTDIHTDNLLAYNAPSSHMPLIYGTIYAGGAINIKGDMKTVNFDINAQTRPKTDVNFDFLSNSTATDYDFITFVDKQKQGENTSDTTKSYTVFSQDNKVELRFNILADVTPDARLTLIMDKTSDDIIQGYGNGNFQVQYGTNSNFRMYGGLNITSGFYNFSLQQFIHRNFQIREGSSINFQGDPMDAILDINAIYNLTASLNDLDQSLANESPRSSIPVNCVMLIDGKMQNPNISFDLELPNSNSELERQMKSLIDTEDMMNRQIVYLLAINKFYTPNYANISYRTNELSAIAASAISAQLSGILNGLTDKVQIGTNIRTGTNQEGLTDTEVDMLLSSQLLDNRLLFNGNFGYKNNPLQQNTFIGEFDLEYKLIRSGEISLKAYNRANDMYRYLKQALTTQGVGILFKKDFTTLKDILVRKRRPLPLPQDSTSTQRN